MGKAYISIGTNIGNKRKNIIAAAALLAERVGDILALSSIYETEPWGFESSNSFLNAALVIKTQYTPFQLLDTTRLIEIEMGRIEKSNNGLYHDRIIDIDILMYDNEIIHTDRLTLPHPLMHKRKFVMQPLAEIVPDVLHPILEKTMESLYLALEME